MARSLLLLICTATILAACSAALAPPTATPVVTLSGAIRHPAPPIAQAQDTPSPTAPVAATTSPSGDLILMPTMTATPAALVLLPTVTATPAALVLLPTVTPTPASGPTLAAAVPITSPVGGNALPAAYRALVRFTSTTTFADGATQEQTGDFTITHVQAANVYGANEAYEMTTAGPDGTRETMTVYEIDDYVAARFAEEDWMVMDRAAGSRVAAAIQPILYLAHSFAQVRERAQDLGVEEANGIPARHFRIDDASLAAELFAQPSFQTTGVVESLHFDAWISEPEGFLIRYTMQMETTGSQVLDAEFQPVSADQRVIWSFDIVELNGDITLAWPEDAPAPGVLEAPGFASGDFPIPPNSRITANYPGFQELVSERGVDEVRAFYRAELAAQGWEVGDEFGLWLCTKDDVTFQLMIEEDTESGGSRVTILSAE